MNESKGIFTSIMSSNSNKSVSNKSFGRTTKRFDANYELKEYFNREPGPGTYSVTTADTSVLG
jgi:hypothetical protein